MSIPLPVSLAIEQGIEAVLKLDPDTRDRLVALEGKVIDVHLTRPSLHIVLSVVDRHVFVLGDLVGEADATIEGSLSALRSLAEGNDALYRGEVVVSGDVAIGQHLKAILAGVDPDWEELMSPFVGDSVAHKMGHAGRQLRAWLSRTQTSLKQNTGEYLQEEVDILAPDLAILAFCSEVDEMRAAVDRLQARITQLERARTHEASGAHLAD